MKTIFFTMATLLASWKLFRDMTNSNLPEPSSK
jgi:hypothetical protein